MNSLVSLKCISDNWLISVRREVKYSTFQRYRFIVNKYLLHEFGNIHITKICVTDIKNYFDCLSHNLKYNSVNCILQVFKNIFRYAVKTGVELNLSVFKSVSLLKSKTTVSTISSTEARRLNQYLMENLSLKSIGVMLALNCGLRLGEICALKCGKINLRQKVIFIDSAVQRLKTDSGKTRIMLSDPKTNNSVRMVPIPDSLCKIIRKIKADNESFLLSGTDKVIEPRRMQYYFSSLCEKVLRRRIKFHDLRHTYATLLLSKGMDVKVVSEILGHSNVNVTLNYYRGVNADDLLKIGRTINKSILCSNGTDKTST